MNISYPATRMRRRRQSDWMRRMVQETHLRVEDLIWPIFLQEENGASDIASLPGVQRLGPDRIVDAVGEAKELGIPAVALFPHVPQELKVEDCSEAWRPDNLVHRSLRSLSASVPDIGLIGDVALDPYNPTGQDGLMDEAGRILNDETNQALVKQSLALAEAGAHIISPSDMMDGRIAAIRSALDEQGMIDVALMSYSAKYASAYYGPFRDAIGSKGALLGDKKTYQMNPANGAEADDELLLDLAEGADMLMIKPGMPYLDIVYRASQLTNVPIVVYQVSGEYAMLKAAAQNGWLDGDKVMMEALMGFKRAGASAIWTYAAVDVARALKQG